MGPNKNRFYVQNGKVYPLTDDMPAEIIISDDDDVAVLGNKFPIGSIAHNLANGTTFVLDPTYTWVQKESGSNSGTAANGVFLINEHVDETDDSLVLDKTFSEIKAAIDAGLLPVIKRSDEPTETDEPIEYYSIRLVPIREFIYDHETGYSLDYTYLEYGSEVLEVVFDGSTENDYPRKLANSDPIV